MSTTEGLRHSEILPPRPDAVRVISANIESHKHLDRLSTLAPYHPDVLCLQEVFLANVPQLQTTFGMDQAHFVPLATITKANAYDLPPLGPWGLLFLTNLETSCFRADYYSGHPGALPEPNTPDANATARALVSATVTKHHLPYILAFTHFTWSADGLTNTQQLIDVLKLLNFLDRFPQLALFGDLNAPRYRNDIWTVLVSYGFIDNIPPHIRSTLDPHLHPAGHLDRMVDAVFTKPGYTAANVQVISGVSDHCAIKTDLSLAKLSA